MPVSRKKGRKNAWRVYLQVNGRQREKIVEGSKADADAYEARWKLEVEAGATTDPRAAPLFSDFCLGLYREHAEMRRRARPPPIMLERLIAAPSGLPRSGAPRFRRRPSSAPGEASPSKRPPASCPGVCPGGLDTARGLFSAGSAILSGRTAPLSERAHTRTRHGGRARPAQKKRLPLDPTLTHCRPFDARRHEGGERRGPPGEAGDKLTTAVVFRPE
jgi:hypothetical protein